MSLSTLIVTEIRNTVSNDNDTWRQFVLDHLDYIAIRSQTFSIEPDLMNMYRYDLKRFLKVYMKRHEDISWIVLLVNSLTSDFVFDTPGNFIIPTDRLITDLYHSYKTITANAT